MEERKSTIITHFIPVPKIFQSFVTASPFDHCITCDQYLLEDGTQYLIEKALNKHDVIFEYAMCLNCAEKMRDTLSKESLQKIESYFNRNSDFTYRNDLIENESYDTVEPWIAQCIIKGTPVSDCYEYQIFALCDGRDMLFNQFPYMIGGEAMAECSELLSAKTRDEMDDFIDDHFGLPPEWKKAMKETDRVLI